MPIAFVDYSLTWHDHLYGGHLSRYCDVRIVDETGAAWYLESYAGITKGTWGEPIGLLQPGWSVCDATYGCHTKERLEAMRAVNGGRTGIMPIIVRAMRDVVLETVQRWPDEMGYGMFGAIEKRAALYRGWTDLHPDLEATPHDKGIVWVRRPGGREPQYRAAHCRRSCNPA